MNCKQAIKRLKEHSLQIIYNDHAQEDQVISGLPEFIAIEIADFIEKQQEQIENMKNCGNCFFKYVKGCNNCSGCGVSIGDYKNWKWNGGNGNETN